MQFYVYILTNQNNNVIYVGMTNDLHRRIFEHKNELIEGFSKKYHVNKLVYYEEYSSPLYAVAREKQLKRWRREKKNELIQSRNPTWDDLFASFLPQ